jgi:hypothetical protein
MDFHPIVNEVMGCLVSEGTNGNGPFQMTQEGADALDEKLRKMPGSSEDFKHAVRDLVSFATFLDGPLSSPAAAEVVIDIVTNNPEVDRIAAEVAREDSADQVDAMGGKFTKFVGTRSAGEEEIEASEPSISAKDLLRQNKLNG